MARSLRKKRKAKVVSRKPKKENQKRFLNPRKVQDEALRARWDTKKTVKQNLESTDVKEMYFSKLPAEIPKAPKHAPKVNEDEAPICAKLAKKHGDDFEAMHWDIKLNELQWTKAVCKKKVTAWKEGKTRSAAAEILSGHGMDMRNLRGKPSLPSPESQNGPNDFEDRTRLGTLNVPRLGVGTISWGLRGFGGLVDKVERTFLKTSGAVNMAEPVVLASTLKGIDFFDTAERYGNSISTALGMGYGETEELVGRTLRDLGIKAVVATKFTPTPGRATPESVVEACEASRRRLGVDVIDLYQIQMPDIVQPWARIPGAPKEWSMPKDEIYWQGMVECYKRGIIANVGVSNYGPTLLKRAHAYFQSRGVPLVSNQINYSLLYRKSGAQATVDAGNELGVTTLAYFPLAMGSLTGKWKSKGSPTELQSQLGIGPVGEPLNPDLTGKSTIEQLEIASQAQQAAPLLLVLEDIARGRGKTVSQVALNWIICKGAIPIPGARTAAQVKDNAGALGWRLSAAEMERLEEAADAVEGEFSGAGFKRSNSKFVGYGYEEWQLD